jgi:hypothetical protein
MGGPAVGIYDQLYAKLVAGADNGTEIMRVGDSVQDDDNAFIILFKFRNKGFNACFGSGGPGAFYLENYSPVTGRKPVQFMLS